MLNSFLVRLIDKSFIIVVKDPRVRQHVPFGQLLCHPNAMCIPKEPIESGGLREFGRDDSLARDKFPIALWGVKSLGAQG